MHFHLITLFPDVCRIYTDSSILGRAQKRDKGKGAKVTGQKIKVDFYNPRDFSTDKHKKVDDRPYGGGPGMVLAAEPILKAWQKAVGGKKQALATGRVKTLIMSPRGRQFTNVVAQEYAEQFDHLVLISGRYEGIDARVKEILGAEEVSIGDYVLTGGELPSLVIVDAVARQIPGVLGEHESLEESRTTNGETYTRPEVLKYRKQSYAVPKVLMEGDHAAIERWRGNSKG